MAKSWRDRAVELKVEVRDRAQHERRWLDSLSPFSAFARALVTPGAGPDVVLGRALDAAVGVALAADRLQRACFGSAWQPRVKSFDVQVRALELPLATPPGCDTESWGAMRAVMMADIDTEEWADVAKVLPAEVELLGRLQREDPPGYKRLADAASAAGAQIDGHTRSDVQLRYDELTDATAFRKEWTELFGKPRIRPAAPTHLAVWLLDAGGMESGRDVALFLRHVGLINATAVGFDEESRTAALAKLDNEVYNARQALKRLREQEPARTPVELIRTIEWVTSEGLRRIEAPPADP